MADAADLKSATFTGVWVRVPPPAPRVNFQYNLDEELRRCPGVDKSSSGRNG